VERASSAQRPANSETRRLISRPWACRGALNATSKATRTAALSGQHACQRFVRVSTVNFANSLLSMSRPRWRCRLLAAPPGRVHGGDDHLPHFIVHLAEQTVSSSSGSGRSSQGG
jgi:hypothetical protein